ncbi:Smr/MutS family protein [Mucilaginibacter glaciei]|uniref:Smr/MutS family protein n=1 Tax=Mucilaginibacter glaciei TaxID=2772109 RepID=A0A926NN47_9SPHI|nr:Smr/MutS family protein [Mucilaginibacter glaciei]MBD1391520.1 Smr/MutS family protein [Mucilaginibacter glaciei]
MRYKLGDFVRFVDEKLEGYITKIIDEQMIGVTVEDDFEIPVLASKVTYVHGHGAASHDEEAVTQTSAITTGEFKSKGVHIAVIADVKANALVHLYLVNETSFQLLASVVTDAQKTIKGEFVGMIEPQSAVKVYSAKLSDLQLWPKFIFQVLFHTRQNQPLELPLNVTEQFKAKDFAGAKKIVPILKQQGWLVQLDQPELIIDAEKLKESFFKPAEEKQVVQKPVAELDLHIEKLRDDHQFLGSSEMLNIQVNAFKHALDGAIVHQMPDITFIHGTGNGILKHELHKLLSKHPKVQTFMDARKEKFGYGATKVVLK